MGRTLHKVWTKLIRDYKVLNYLLDIFYSELHFNAQRFIQQ